MRKVAFVLAGAFLVALGYVLGSFHAFDPAPLWAQSEPRAGSQAKKTVAPNDSKNAPAAEAAQVDTTGVTAVASPVQQVDVPEDLEPLYANFFRVTASPEETILDFGLNAQMNNTQFNKARISQRVVINFYTAKRIWGALGLALQRHEQAFGVIETDVNKRAAGARPRPGTTP